MTVLALGVPRREWNAGAALGGGIGRGDDSDRIRWRRSGSAHHAGFGDGFGGDRPADLEALLLTLLRVDMAAVYLRLIREAEWNDSKGWSVPTRGGRGLPSHAARAAGPVGTSGGRAGWFGAHPAAPARCVRSVEGAGDPDSADTDLLTVIQADPAHELGAASVGVFGERLPFLLKVLAAEEPLSLQAHPSLAQASEGFARENALGLALDAPERNYRDPWHKPELVVALTEFDALAGFRMPDRTLELLRELQVPALDPYLGLLAGQADCDGLRAVFTTWLTLPEKAIMALVPAVLEGAVAVLGSGATESGDELRTLPSSSARCIRGTRECWRRCC